MFTSKIVCANFIDTDLLSLILSLVADLYITVFDFARSNPLTGHGREGFYFGENGETSYLNVVNAIGQAMVELGISKSAEPTSYTKEEMDKYFGVGYTFLSPMHLD